MAKKGKHIWLWCWTSDETAGSASWLVGWLTPVRGEWARRVKTANLSVFISVGHRPPIRYHCHRLQNAPREKTPHLKILVLSSLQRFSWSRKAINQKKVHFSSFLIVLGVKWFLRVFSYFLGLVLWVQALLTLLGVFVAIPTPQILFSGRVAHQGFIEDL